MKAGYVALFGMVVAYSAYQGGSASNAAPSPQALGTSRGSANVVQPAPADQSKAGTELFPTIAGGMCQLNVNEDSGPCGDCKAICPAKGLTDLIEDYFRAEARGDSESLKFVRRHWYVPQAKQWKIKFVIASLPDPVHTHMALLFDREIETIQSAAQADGYLFSRAWMPWDISTHNESMDFTVRMAQGHLQDQKETLPGLMIFQKSGGASRDADSILFVFVVSETATGGLRIEQFQNALLIRERILAGSDPKQNAGEGKLLRIYGPTFSGSLLSLGAVLSAQPHDPSSTTLIRSGSISSYRAVHDFCESARVQWPDEKGRPDFATFQFSDKYQEFYLSYFFYERDESHSHVAVLSEDETAFGNQEASTQRTSSTDGGGQNFPTTPDLCPVEPPNPLIPLMRLYFPRGIAQLRDAYQRDVKMQLSADGTKNLPQNGVALNLSVTGNDDDTVAPYSPLQTPPSQESILQGIVVTLRQEHAKVVIIRAGDPLDMIFLSRYLRQNYPQARLVTVGADLLMLHDFYDPRFHGILAVTTYPILTGVRFPTWVKPASALKSEGAGQPVTIDSALVSKTEAGPPPDIQHVFPDNYSVGYFNAFQSLLATTPESAPRTLPGGGYAQFGLPSFLQPDNGQWRAHLWLTTVGRDSYWPVSVLDDVPLADLQAKIPEARIPESTVRPVTVDAKDVRLQSYSVHFSVSWAIFWVLTLGLTVFLSVLLLFPDAFTRSETLGRFGGNPLVSRDRLLFMGSMLLLAAQTIFALPAIVWCGHFGNPYGDGLGLVMACYLISVGLLGVACYQRFRKRGSDRLGYAGIIVCVVVIVVTLGLTFYFGSVPVTSRLGAFLYRYINVGSGVSPSLPILFLLAAWIWWCWQSLTGVVSADEKQVVLPKTSDFTPVLVPAASERVRLKTLSAEEQAWPWEALGAVPLDRKIVISAAVGFALIMLLMQPWEIAEAFESTPYKVVYWFLLYSCLLLVCYLVTHIVALWLEFRNLLNLIERIPFRRGLSDLKNLTWKPLWKLAGNGRQEFLQMLGGEADALTQIDNGGWLHAGLTTAIKEAEDAKDKVAADYEDLRNRVQGATRARVVESFHLLQASLARAASGALIHANKQWKQEPYAPPSQPDGKAAPAEPPAKEPTMRAIEHFLCLFYVNIILVPLRRLQTLILAMAGVFVFVLLSYSSYPFESRESFHVLLISIFFVISLVVGIVYGQMYSNPLLSRITNTTPGELGLDFWVRLGTFVFIPLLSLLSVQFPEMNRFLFSWVQPALQSIK
jgi:hypothetical protein